MEKKKVSIIGGASISSAFLMKILAHHKHVKLQHVFSTSQTGEKVSDCHAFLNGIVDAHYEALSADKLIDDSNIVFITKHHGEFLNETANFVKAAKESRKPIKFIDLSADFRLKDAETYKQWYGVEHTHSALLADAVYGLPELHKEQIKNAYLVANPGCYPTCAILSLAPLLHAGTKHGGIFINALSGVSGAGLRPSPKNTAMSVSENIYAYKVGGTHPHTPEIEQTLSKVSGEPIKVTFVPHVAPFKYGIIQTIYVKLHAKPKEEALHSAYADFYKGSRFINILPLKKLPEVKDVVGTNFVNIGFSIDHRTDTLIIVSCIDNIIKGAAGQAVQNMNIMCGYDEGEGLL